jgi:hypothetical protein
VDKTFGTHPKKILLSVIKYLINLKNKISRHAIAPRKTPVHNDAWNNYKVATKLYLFPKKKENID